VVNDLAVHPTDPDTVYEAQSGAVLLFKTTDGGATWVQSDKGLIGDRVYALAIDPAIPNTLYAGTEHGVFKSTDGAGSWTATEGIPPSVTVEALAVDPVNMSTAYAGAIEPVSASGGGVYKSTDGGMTWVRASVGIGDNRFNDRSVSALAIDPSQTATIYANAWCPDSDECNVSEIYKTTDAAATWVSSLFVFYQSWLSSLVIDPSATSTVFAGHVEHGVYLTTDGGATWALANEGLTDRTVDAMAVQPAPPYSVYVGTPSGVFKFEKER
jgi:photosystem II stability/assembly factor-like uncharacterized protein